MGIIEMGTEGTGHGDRVREVGARQYLPGRRHDGGPYRVSLTPRIELNAVRWQVKSLESSRSVAPLDPKHELLYELLCLRQEVLVDICAEHRRGRSKDAVFA